MSHTSDFGSDRIELGGAVTELFTGDALHRGTAPIKYRILYVQNEEEHIETFRSRSCDRAETMRSRFGIDADNDRWALQTLQSDERWSKPIGNKELAEKLRKLR